MRAYVITTGVIFGLITLAHIARLFAEPRETRNPWFILLTVLVAGLCVWACRLMKSSRG